MRSLIVSLALASCATASTVPPVAAPICANAKVVPPAVAAQTPNSTYYSDGLPPARYRQNRDITLKLSTQDEINQICGKAPCPNQLTLGCQQPKQLVVPNPCSYGASDRYASLICHELGHVNGWPATHGD